MAREPLPEDEVKRSRSLRLTQEQWDFVDAVARGEGITGAEVIRDALRRRFRRSWPTDPGTTYSPRE